MRCRNGFFDGLLLCLRRSVRISPRKKRKKDAKNRVTIELYSLRATKAERFRALCAYLVLRHKARGATCAASLKSELFDSALLGYLSLSLRSTVQGEANLSISAKTEKSTQNACFFLANDYNFDANVLFLRLGTN